MNEQPVWEDKCASSIDDESLKADVYGDGHYDGRSERSIPDGGSSWASASDASHDDGGAATCKSLQKMTVSNTAKTFALVAALVVVAIALTLIIAIGPVAEEDAAPYSDAGKVGGMDLSDENKDMPMSVENALVMLKFIRGQEGQ